LVIDLKNLFCGEGGIRSANRRNSLTQPHCLRRGWDLYHSPKTFTGQNSKELIKNTHRITNRINCWKLMQFVGCHNLYLHALSSKGCKYMIFTFATQLKVLGPHQL